MGEIIFVKTYEEVLPDSDSYLLALTKCGKISATKLAKNIKIYSLTSEKQIIKQVIMCEIPGKSCNSTTINDLVYEYKNKIDNITIIQILVPDFIMEILVMKRMSECLSQNLIFGVRKMKSYALDLKCSIPTINISMNDDMTSLIFEDNSETTIAYNLFMVMCNLVLLQYYMRFTHYDLHWGNIGITISKEPKCFFFPEVLNPIKFTNTKGTWAVIGNFNSCVFSTGSSLERKQYINTSTSDNKNQSEFDEYFDCLTLLKSTELILKDGWNISFIPNILNCFFKSGVSPEDYYTTGTYLPNKESILNKSSGLYKPLEILFGLYNIIKSSKIITSEKCIESDLVIGYSEKIEIPPVKPILSFEQIIDFPLSVQKKYSIGKLNCEVDVIREIYMKKIFAFSFYITNETIEDIYKYFYEPTEWKKEENRSKFYWQFLEKQINGCISLINNDNVNASSIGSDRDQWKDFGCLFLIDNSILNLPVLVLHNDVYVPWLKNEHKPDINMFNLSNRNLLATKIKEFEKTTLMERITEYGTILDYIKYRFSNDIKEPKRHRVGLYKYTFLDSGLSVTADGVKNSNGFLGSIAKFFVLQDPKFDVVLFRDAQTLPNRNYLYDRKWYNQWIKGDKKFWVYHGVFYNPPHLKGIKSGSASTWGVRKTFHKQTSILSSEEFIKIFEMTEKEDTSYGVDERLLYKLYGDPSFKSQAYLVGIINFYQILTGQANPRLYVNCVGESGKNIAGKRIMFDTNFNDDVLKEKFVKANSKIATTDALYKGTIGLIISNDKTQVSKLQLDAKDAGIPIFTVDEANNYFFDKQDLLCRPYTNSMSSTSFYTDMRCIFLEFANMAAQIKKVARENLSVKDFFEVLEDVLKSPEEPDVRIKYGQKLQKMLPPRWHILDYLFTMCDEDIDSKQFDQYLESVVGDQINLSTICNINKSLWTGDDFNFDKYFFGKGGKIPDQIKLPEDYPSNT